MRPSQFLALAVAAVICAGAALVVYSTSVEWSRVGNQSGQPLVAALRKDSPEVEKIEIAQADKKLTLERDGETWTVKERDGFPADTDKVRTFIANVAEANLVEPRTGRADRYALLGLEDPKTKEATSHLVRLLDGSGDTLAEIVVGRQRHAFGSGTGGTYIRMPAEDQTWLVDASIDANTGIASWVKPQLFEAQPSNIKRLTLIMPGDEPLEIERPADGRHTLVPMPDGMKLKYTNVIDEIVSGASAIAFDDVRKQIAAPDDAGKIEVELDSGLKVVFTVNRKDGHSWLSLEATGEGDGKKAAETLMARAKGWEFRIPEGKAERMFKRREDILEQTSS